MKLPYSMSRSHSSIVANLMRFHVDFTCGSQPIERMVDFVKELAEDPVSFAGKALTQPVAPSVGRVIFHPMFPFLVLAFKSKPTDVHKIGNCNPMFGKY